MKALSTSVVKDIILDAGRRVLRVLQYGAKTADVYAPFGDDSAPLSDMVALYGETSEVGDAVIIGYINENQIAKPGEKRIYSLNADGSLATQIYLKNDGNIDVGQALDNPVRFTSLDAALRSQDGLIQAELVKIAAAINGIVPGSYVPGTVTTDISSSKVNEIKL